MLRPSPSRGPVPPMDWIGRANAGSGLDLRPTGPRKLTRLAWPRDAAVATGAIARPPPRLNYVEESFRVLGRPFSDCLGNGVHRVALGRPRGSVSPPVCLAKNSGSIATRSTMFRLLIIATASVAYARDVFHAECASYEAGTILFESKEECVSECKKCPDAEDGSPLQSSASCGRDDFREIWGGKTMRNRHRHDW
jgi:hypothetical protein